MTDPIPEVIAAADNITHKLSNNPNRVLRADDVPREWVSVGERLDEVMRERLLEMGKGVV